MNETEVRQIYLHSFETHFFISLKTSLQFYDKLGQPYPLRLYVALTGVKGFAARPSRYSFLDETHLVDRDQLLFDPILINGRDDDIEKSLQSLLNQLWNAGGYPRSLSYDENGLWDSRAS